MDQNQHKDNPPPLPSADQMGFSLRAKEPSSLIKPVLAAIAFLGLCSSPAIITQPGSELSVSLPQIGALPQQVGIGKDNVGDIYLSTSEVNPKLNYKKTTKQYFFKNGQFLPPAAQEEVE